jgi:RNA polymerase sigma-70 factor (ECF subfamily)
MHWVRSTVREKAAFARFERESSDAPRRPDALSNLISAERARDVKRAIERLATDDQRLLGMIYYDALDTDEIAGRVGITAAAVRVRKHRALQRLAAQLGETA